MARMCRKGLHDMDVVGQYKDGKCRECRREYRQRNREKRLEYRREYYQRNREKMLEQQRERWATDPMFRVVKGIQKRINRATKRIERNEQLARELEDQLRELTT